jgi:hypothetical protein
MDILTKTGQIDLHINRFHITNTVKNDLLIVSKPSRNSASLVVFVFFGGMGAFFFYISYNMYITEGIDAVWLPLAFAIFPTCMGVLSLVAGYFGKTTFLFRTNEVICQKLLSVKKVIARADVKSVYISKTLFRESGKPAHDFAYWIALQVPNMKNNSYSLFNVESRDSISGVFGAMDNVGMDIAERESLTMARIISEHWNIPLRAPSGNQTDTSTW